MYTFICKSNQLILILQGRNNTLLFFCSTGILLRRSFRTESRTFVAASSCWEGPVLPPPASAVDPWIRVCQCHQMRKIRQICCQRSIYLIIWIQDVAEFAKKKTLYACLSRERELETGFYISVGLIFFAYQAKISDLTIIWDQPEIAHVNLLYPKESSMPFSFSEW